MSAVSRLFAKFTQDDNDYLRQVIADIAVHIGGSPGLPWTVVEAAESTRVRLNQHLGHLNYPRHEDGTPVPFVVVGR